MGQSSIVSTSRKLSFSGAIPVGVSFYQYYIDIAQCLSICNRRSYRQAQNYAIQNMIFYSSDGGDATISIIPPTWVADNATTKAFETWKDQRAEVLREQPSLKAKWSDFKIFMDSSHVALGTLANLTPLNAPASGATPYILGTWDASEYVCPLPGADQAVAGDAQEVRFHVVGDHVPPGAFDTHTTSVGLIKAYGDSRARVLYPDPVVPGEMTTGFYNVNSSPDEKSQDIMDNVANRNDDPPYNPPNYIGGDTNAPDLTFQDFVPLYSYGTSGAVRMGSVSPFVAPFGLLRITFTRESGVDPLVPHVFNFTIELPSGKYKGILAERGV